LPPNRLEELRAERDLLVAAVEDGRAGAEGALTTWDAEYGEELRELIIDGDLT
jgi:hypothetical protein